MARAGKHAGEQAMISRRSFLTHLLAAAALVPLLGVEHADARKKARVEAKPSRNRSHHAALRRRRAALRPARNPVSRRAYVRAPRYRLEEGWPHGWMDPHWYRSSGDPFFDPGRWN
jgi:hypothetical protein